MSTNFSNLLPDVVPFSGLNLSQPALLAASTPDQVFKSMGDSLDTQANPNHLILIGVGLLAMIVLIAVLTRQKEKKEKPKTIHNSAKLTRQLARHIGLKPKEMRQLKQLAEQEKLENPLVLLLCPSMLQAAMKKRQAARK